MEKINDFDYLISLINNPDKKGYMEWIIKGEEKDIELFVYWLQLFNITPEQKQEVMNKVSEEIDANKSTNIIV